MFRFIKITVFTLSVLLTLSCSKNHDSEINDSTQIEFGTVCGWCKGSGFITILKDTIEYSPNTCGGNQGFNKTSQSFANHKWEELVACFDYNYFITLDYNVCNVCADGCDEIIRITKNNKVHEIRYNPAENIEGLEILQKKLREYLADFYKSN